MGAQILSGGSGKASLEPTVEQRPKEVRDQTTQSRVGSVWARGAAGAKALSWELDQPELSNEASVAGAEQGGQP